MTTTDHDLGELETLLDQFRRQGLPIWRRANGALKKTLERLYDAMANVNDQIRYARE